MIEEKWLNTGAKTTVDERNMIGEVMEVPFVKIEHAKDLLYSIWDEFFTMREQEPLSKYEAERIGNVIWFALEALEGALTDYELATAAPDSILAKKHVERAKTYEFALLVEQTRRKAVDVAWKTVPEKIKAACNLPDAEALSKLQEIIKEATK